MPHKKTLKVVECPRACLSFRNLLSRFVLLSIITYLAFSILPLSADEQPDKFEFESISERIRQEFDNGNVEKAISLIDEILDKEDKSLPSYRALLIWKLQICDLFQDTDCNYLESRRLGTVPFNGNAELMDYAYYNFSNIIPAKNHQEWLNSFPVQSYWAQAMKFVNPPMYVKTSLLEAFYHSKLDHVEEARLAVDRAISLLVSLEGIEPESFSYLLREALHMLTITGDTRRVVDLLAVSKQFLEKYAAGSLPILFSLRMTMFDIYLHAFDVKLSRVQLEEAGELLQRITLPRHLQELWQRKIMYNQLAVCLANDDTPCILNVTKILRWPTDLDQYNEVGLLRTVDAYLTVAAKVLGSAISQQRVDEKWIELLKHMEGMSLSQRDAAFYESYGQVARAFYSGEFETDSTHINDLVEATSTRLQYFSEQLRRSGDGLVLPDIFSLIIFRLTASALADQPRTQSKHADIIFRLSEVINRNITHVDSDALAILSNARTHEERRVVHTRQRLAKKRFIRERYLLATLLSRFEDPSRQNSGKLINTESDLQLSDLKKKEISLSEYLSEKDFDNQHHLPSLDELRETLQSDEAFLTIVPGADNPLILCITDNQFQLQNISVPSDEILKDKKLLMLSLTAIHTPSPTLDRQFPAGTANRLYQALIAPVKDCAKSAKNWIWANNSLLQGMPLTPLLIEMPQGDDGSYDLAGAQWLGLRHAISTVVSAQAFIALRSQIVSNKGSRTFLGIGNPRLSGQTVAGISQDEAVTKRTIPTRNGSLSILEELPETEDELRAIRKNLGEPAILLTQDNATERHFRRQPLPEFQTLNFATHGLLRDDISGLTESALVLTPRNMIDEWDDGLLTATEIADLDLNAYVVGLSACNTANFDWEVFGAEIPSLTSAFALAGVNTTIATLWPVESQTSKDIMSLFFKTLRNSNQNIGAAEALRKSLSHFISNPPSQMYTHPRFWAPFIVYGDGGSPLPRKSDKSTQKSTPLTYEIWDTPGTGEVLDIQTTMQGKGFLIAGAYGQRVGEQFYSFVSRLDEKGKAIWTFRDKDLIYADIMQLKEAVIVAGFSRVNGDQAIPTIYAINNQGRLIWKRQLAVDDKQTKPLGIILLPNDKILLMLQSWKEKIGGPLQSLVAVTLTSEGAIVSKASYDLPKSKSWHKATFMHSEEQSFVSVRSVLSYTRSKQPDLMGNMQMCLKPEDLLLLSYDFSANKFLLINEYQQIRLSDVVTANNGLTLFAGSLYKECKLETTAAVFSLDRENKLQVFYRDTEPFSSYGAAILEEKNGSLRLVGTTTRPLDTSFGYSYYNADLLVDFAKVKHFSRGEGFIQSLTKNGEPDARTWLTTGSVVFINDATIERDHLLIGGSSDWQVMWALYK